VIVTFGAPRPAFVFGEALLPLWDQTIEVEALISVGVGVGEDRTTEVVWEWLMAPPVVTVLPRSSRKARAWK
jgi:hypothetical protein